MSMLPVSGFRFFLSTSDSELFGRFEALRRSLAGQIDFELILNAPKTVDERARAGDLVIFDLGQTSEREADLPDLETIDAAFFTLFLISDQKELGVEALEKMRGGFVLPRQNFEDPLSLNLRLLLSSAFGRQLFLSKKTVKKAEKGEVLRDHFFIRHRKLSVRVEVADILWVKAAGSAVEIVTRRDRLAASMNLNSFLAQTQSPKLRRVHRSYAVNEEAVESFDRSFVYMAHPNGAQAIPIGENAREALFQRLKKLKAD